MMELIEVVLDETAQLLPRRGVRLDQNEKLGEGLGEHVEAVLEEHDEVGLVGELEVALGEEETESAELMLVLEASLEVSRVLTATKLDGVILVGPDGFYQAVNGVLVAGTATGTTPGRMTSSC